MIVVNPVPAPCRAASLLLAALVSPAVLAQAPGGWHAFASVTPVYQSPADLDAGGDMSTGGALARVGVIGPITDRSSAGMTLSYDYIDYDFDAPRLLGTAAPWGTVYRLGLAVPLMLRSGETWSFAVTPSLDSFREDGADWDDSLSYGAIFAASRSFGPGRRIGIGLGVFERPEETRAFPFVAIDWPLSERLRITNPLPAGPTGPAGLELRYRFDSGWEAGVGAAYRSYRFRLSQSAPTPDGIGEEEAVPAFLRLSRSFGAGFGVDLYAGALLAGKLRVEDRDGREVEETDFDPAALFAVTLTARF
jgi:hypothetical protein